MASVDLNNVAKVYEGGVRAVHDFDRRIAVHEFIVVVGPSGCGKTRTSSRSTRAAGALCDAPNRRQREA